MTTICDRHEFAGERMLIDLKQSSNNDGAQGHERIFYAKVTLPLHYGTQIYWTRKTRHARKEFVRYVGWSEVGDPNIWNCAVIVNSASCKWQYQLLSLRNILCNAFLEVMFGCENKISNSTCLSSKVIDNKTEASSQLNWQRLGSNAI